MHIVNIHEAKTKLSALLAEVSSGGEVVIAKAGKPIARIVPIDENIQPRKLGGDWEGKVWMADDFDNTPDSIIESFYNSKIYPDGE